MERWNEGVSIGTAIELPEFKVQSIPTNSYIYLLLQDSMSCMQQITVGFSLTPTTPGLQYGYFGWCKCLGGMIHIVLGIPGYIIIEVPWNSAPSDLPICPWPTLSALGMRALTWAPSCVPALWNICRATGSFPSLATATRTHTNKQKNHSL